MDVPISKCYCFMSLLWGKMWGRRNLVSFLDFPGLGTISIMSLQFTTLPSPSNQAGQSKCFFCLILPLQHVPLPYLMQCLLPELSFQGRYHCITQKWPRIQEQSKNFTGRNSSWTYQTTGATEQTSLKLKEGQENFKQTWDMPAWWPGADAECQASC